MSYTLVVQKNRPGQNLYWQQLETHTEQKALQNVEVKAVVIIVCGTCTYHM